MYGATPVELTRLHKTLREANSPQRASPTVEDYPLRWIDQIWLLRSCERFRRLDGRGADALLRVEANPGLCKLGCSLGFLSV